MVRGRSPLLVLRRVRVRLMLTLGCAAALATDFALAQPSVDSLFEQVSAGARCWQSGDSRHCSYNIDNILSIAITRVGEPEVLVSFPLSNCDRDICAAMYGGCAMVLSKAAPSASGGSGPVVYISPRNGVVYKTFDECRRSK